MEDNKNSAIIYLKDRLHKWKTIAIIAIVFSSIISLKCIFKNNNSSISKDEFIAEVKIEGIIFEDDYRSKILHEIAENNKIKAVIVVINSPGGGIVGSEILYNDLTYISSKKPIVVQMASIATSGGYMASMASDYIIAYNGTLTGSIGVIMESPEITELAQKIGVKFNTYKSSSLKGSPSPFEKSNAQVDKVINEAISDSYKFFVELVLSKRADKILPNMRNNVFDGRVFTGRQALKVGLIDKIGNQQDALNYLSTKNVNIKKLKIEEIKIIEEKNSFFDKFFDAKSFFPDLINNMTYKENKIMAIFR